MNVPDTADNTAPEPPDRVAYYRAILSRGGGPGGSALESREGTAPQADLSAPAIAERLKYTRKAWRQVIKTHLGDKPHLQQLVLQLTKEVDRPLQLVAEGDAAQVNQPGALSQLESIVRLDGSRPSFMVRNDAVDFTTSPPGIWKEQLFPEADTLRQTVQGVGRINDPGNLREGFEGTGVLVAPNLLMTNRHVLDRVARLTPDQRWTFRPGVHVDFNHEWNTDRPLRRRQFRAVAFAARPLAAGVDHADTDLVLLELEPDTDKNSRFAIDCSVGWAAPGTYVYIVGYPANPGEPQSGSGVTLTLLEKLFGSTYGHKRLAPGMLLGPHELPPVTHFTSRNLAHDATTLGGNSGSVLVPGGRLTLAAGLHYAGRWREPRTNWGHVLMNVLDTTDARTGTSLGDVLKAGNARFYAPN